MDNIPDRVDNFLSHYASDNYDPEKAREYYMRTRELKGREKNTAGMSEEQKQAWAYTKNKVSTDKKAALTSEQANFKARMDELRNKATETRDRIRGKLTAFLDSVKVKRPDKIEAKHIDPPELIPIPDNIPEKRKAYLQKQNSLRLQKYGREVNAAEKEASDARAVAAEAYNAAQKSASESSAKAKEDANVERERVGTELKSAVSNARNAYVEAKKQLVAKFEATTNAEYDNIRTKMPGAPPKEAKSGAAGKAKSAATGKPKAVGKAKVVPEAKAKPEPSQGKTRSQSQAEAQSQAAPDPNTMMKSKTARFN